MIEKPAYWAKSKIFINGQTQRRLMVVLKTPLCQKAILKGKCFICGFEAHSRGIKNPYYNLSLQFKFLEDLIKKNKIDHIDVLSSGSVLDEKQIDYQQVLKLMKRIKRIKQIKGVLIEGRTEFCYLDKIKQIKQVLGKIKLEYGIGLEAWSDYVRNTILKKDLKLKDYINCLKKLTKTGTGICTYVLAGYPKLSLKKSLAETKKTIIGTVHLYKKYHCRGRIALFPIFIAPNTPLETLYNQGKYQLVKLQDILKILLEIKQKINLKKYPIFVGLDDENLANKPFLKPVNLEEKKVLEFIKKFNSTQEM